MKIDQATRDRLYALKSLTLSAARAAHNSDYRYYGDKLTVLVSELIESGADVLDICDAQNGK